MTLPLQAPAEDDAAQAPLAPAATGGWYRWYVVFALAVVYAFNVIDRNFLSLLQEPIKKELHLSDAQLGSLTGLAFAVFYATLAIPIARIADRSSRKVVVSVAIGLWSLMTAVSGMATSYIMLLLARMGVGVGEAGGYPPSASILADYFGRDRRATALAIFGIGAPIGGMLGLFLGGWLNGLFGWRLAFIIIGAAGMLIAPIILLTVREPRRGSADIGNDALDDASRAGILDVAKVLWRLKAYRFLLAANMMHGFALYAYSAWTPPFYSRVFHLPTDKIGLYLGILAGVGGLGTYMGGVLSDRLGRKDPRWYVWVPGVAAALALPTAIIQFMAGNLQLSLAMAIFPSFFLYVFVGPTIAIGQSMVLPHMRATTSAITLMTYNIFGLGLGPFMVGLLSDYLRQHTGLGVESLRFAIPAAVLLEAVAAVFYFFSGRLLEGNLERDRRKDFAKA